MEETISIKPFNEKRERNFGENIKRKSKKKSNQREERGHELNSEGRLLQEEGVVALFQVEGAHDEMFHFVITTLDFMLAIRNDH